jgi:hypothetical protein
MAVAGHGSSAPRRLATAGDALAENRRVELRVNPAPRIAEPEPREPLPLPGYVPPEEELDLEPFAGAQRGFKFTRSFSRQPLRLSQDFVLFLSGEISGTVVLTEGKQPATSVIPSLNWRGGGPRVPGVEVRIPLNRLLEAKIDPSGITLAGKSLPINPEVTVVTDPLDLILGKLVALSTSTELKTEFPTESGIWGLSAKVKLKGTLGLSPEFITRAVTPRGIGPLALKEAVIIGGIVVAIIVVPLTVHEIMRAHEAGAEAGQRYSQYDGFARRVAGEAAGHVDPSGRAARYRGDEQRSGFHLHEEAYFWFYSGWEAGGRAFEQSDFPARAQLAEIAARIGAHELARRISEALRQQQKQPLPYRLDAVLMERIAWD